MREGESDTLEFKRSTGQRREGATTLCAMLNCRGGRVIFGVESDGRIVGQQVSDHTVEEVAQEINEIEPAIRPEILRVNICDNLQVIVVTVQSGQLRPYTYKGSVFYRVGNTNQRMSREEYNRVLVERLHGEQRWENQPAVGWTLQDLNTTEVVRTAEEAIRRGRLEDPGTRDVSEILRGLGLVKNGSLLRAAIVLFGKAERLMADYPQCLLRVARFRGKDKTEFIDNRQHHGNAFELLLAAEQFLRANLPIAGRIVPDLFVRQDDPLYPPVALREALANAFCHRDYSIGGGSVAVAIYDDRLEVTSSGVLHFGLTPEALYQPHESLPWNPLIARVFFRRGVIEAWGRGTVKIVELAKRAGLPAPRIEVDAGCVTVQFFPGQYVPPQRIGHDLTERQQNILARLAERSLALREMELLVGQDTPQWMIKQDLALLRGLGLVEISGHGRGAYWRLKK